MEFGITPRSHAQTSSGLKATPEKKPSFAGAKNETSDGFGECGCDQACVGACRDQQDAFCCNVDFTGCWCSRSPECFPTDNEDLCAFISLLELDN